MPILPVGDELQQDLQKGLGPPFPNYSCALHMLAQPMKVLGTPCALPLEGQGPYLGPYITSSYYKIRFWRLEADCGAGPQGENASAHRAQLGRYLEVHG